jgi:DNA modification methylase
MTLPDILNGQPYHVHHGDAIPHMATLPPACFDMAVFSPPFPILYAYTDQAADIGNSEDLKGEAKIHLSFFYRQLRRLLKPGRVVVVHVMQIPRLKRTGEVGVHDFRGLNIRLGERAGLVYKYDWLIAKNPQQQAIRTHSHELQFAGMERDRAECRGALGDYLIKFQSPGENAVPVDSPGQVSRTDWIHWAASHWDDIKPNDTINLDECRAPEDTRHICPLQKTIYRRLTLLYTNPDEIVFEPFAGGGSGGIVALQEDRRYYGCELKDEYHAACLKNLNRAIRARESESASMLPGFDDTENDAPTNGHTPEPGTWIDTPEFCIAWFME